MRGRPPTGRSALGLAALAAAALGACAGDPGGNYGLGRRDGVWWFTAPDGGELVSLGVNHIEPVLLASEGNRAIFTSRYGADLLGPEGKGDILSQGARRWMDDSVERIRSWGFNTVGVHNPIPQRKLPYVAIFRPVPIDGWAGLERKYVDPFDPEVAQFLKGRAAAWCVRNAADPLILGISFNDMPIWRASVDGRMNGWVRHIMGLGAEAPGKRRWVQVLRRNYPGPIAAGAAYGVAAQSWDDLLARTEWGPPRIAWAAFKDASAFLPEIADAWYGAMTAAIRSCDRSHLVFGDKLEGSTDLPAWMYPIIGRHFDLAYIQWYAEADRQETKLAELHAATGEPILMGDSSFSHPNENVRSPKGVHVSSEKEVGRHYARYLKAMMQKPYVVGWHHCGFIEGSPDLRRFHPYFAIQSGFLRPDGTPYAEALAEVVRANAKAAARHAAAKAGPRPIWAVGKTRQGARRCHHSSRRAFEISQVDDNVFNLERVAAPGLRTPNKSISWIITDEGVVVVDAGARHSGIAARAMIRSMTDRPIRYIVYTHHHGTQIGGAGEIAEPGTKIIAHEDLPLELDLIRKMRRYNARLNSIQFNLPFVYDENARDDTRYPDVTYRDEHAFSLGGATFELRHAVGETSDYTVVRMPGQGIVWTGDLVGPSVPLVGSPMKIVRDDARWRRSLERIRALEPEVLIGAVGRPMCEPQAIDAKLDATIDYLGFLNDAVSRELNAGSTLEQALDHIRVPDGLSQNPWVGAERYGNLDFNVRGLYSRYSGWFDQNGTSLDRAPGAARAGAFVADMGGRRAVLARVASLEKASEWALALEYVDLLLEIDGGDADAHGIKGRLLRKLSKEHLDNPLMLNMYLRLSKDEEEASVTRR